MIMRPVQKAAYVPARGTGFIKGGSWEITLECGHVEYRGGSARLPRIAKCRECEKAASLRLQHQTIGKTP